MSRRDPNLPCPECGRPRGDSGGDACAACEGRTDLERRRSAAYRAGDTREFRRLLREGGGG